MTVAMDAGVILGSGTADYTAEAALATAYTPDSSETYGPFTLGAGHVLHLYSLYLTPDTWALRLDNLAGSVDWGLSIHAPGSQGAGSMASWCSTWSTRRSRTSAARRRRCVSDNQDSAPSICCAKSRWIAATLFCARSTSARASSTAFRASGGKSVAPRIACCVGMVVMVL